jgi:hypothetical protein
MSCVLFADAWTEGDMRVLQALKDSLDALGKSWGGMGARRIADQLVNHNPCVHVSKTHLAYLLYAANPLFLDEDRRLKIAVRGIVYEPTQTGHVLAAMGEDVQPNA